MGYNPPTMKKFLVTLFVFVTLFFSQSPVFADEEIRQLTVDLKAKGFTQSIFVNELKSTDINFGPNDKFQLQLKISNKGNRNQTNIKVKEILPSFITTDAYKSFTISQIAAGQDYVQNIVVTIKDKQNVYANLTRGQITFNAISEVGTKSEDSLAFYVGNGIYSPQVSTISAKTLPKTGSTNLIIGSIFAISTLGFSLFLRRLARGY